MRKLRLPGWLQVLCKPLKTLTFVGGRRTRRWLRRKLIAKSHESGDKEAEEGVLSFNVKAPCYYVFPPLPPPPSYLRFQWNWSQYLSHVLLTPFPRCLRYSGQSRGRRRWLCIGKWLPFIEIQRPEEFHFIPHLYLRKRRRNCANSVLNMSRRNCMYLSLKQCQEEGV